MHGWNLPAHIPQHDWGRGDRRARRLGCCTRVSISALTLTCANYVRYLPIATGDVRPTNLALTWVGGDRNEMLRRATDDPGVDGGETSMAQHVQRLDRGDRSLVAIPIFPLRNFTARDLYTRKGTSIAADALGGRRLGIYNWAQGEVGTNLVVDLTFVRSRRSRSLPIVVDSLQPKT